MRQGKKDKSTINMEKKKKSQLVNKTIYEEDISYSEFLDIYKVISHEDKTWSCTCPYWITNKEDCLHIKHYKEHHFDPAFITDNADCYRWYRDIDLIKMGEKGYKFKNMIEDYPRWIIEFILNHNLEVGYSKRRIAGSLEVSEYKLNILIKLLKEYREQEKGRLNNQINSIIQENQVENFVMMASNLKSLPESIGNYTNVRSINLTSNRLVRIPKSIGNLPLLEKLILYDNKLIELPDSIGNLSNLKELQLVENKLISLPESFGNLSKLEKLDARYNKLNTLPESFGKVQSLNILNLEQNNLNMLPKSFGNLRNLKELNLSKNELNFLPESFGNLNNLEVLSLTSNNFTNIPKSLVSLNSLKVLYLSSNPLKQIPNFISKLTSLKFISLAGTHITTLPESFSNLKSLEFVNLGYGYTHLNHLPNSVKNFLKTIEEQSGNPILAPFIWELVERNSKF